MGKPNEMHDGDEFIDDLDDAGSDNDDLDYGDDFVPGDDEPPKDQPPADDDDDGNGSPVVPHARFHEVNEALKLERKERERLEALLQQQQPIEQEPELSLDEKMQEMINRHAELLYSGEEEEAKKVMAEMLRMNQLQSVEIMKQEQNAIREEEQWQQSCIAVVQQYPILADGEGQNKEALADVLEFTKLYQARGISRAQAVQMAADKVCPMYGAEPATRKTSSNRSEAIRRNAADSQRIPPTARGGMGERGRGSQLDPSAMTDEELAKLPESEKAKLRGDFV